jgi:hypothetical protein
MPGRYPNSMIAAYISSSDTWAASYLTVNASLSRNTSTLSSVSIPASSDRTATTLSGQLSQVTPPTLFIIPSTNRVTLDSSASVAATRTDSEASMDAITSGKTRNHLDLEYRIQIDSKSLMDGDCLSLWANITPVPTIGARLN